MRNSQLWPFKKAKHAHLAESVDNFRSFGLACTLTESSECEVRLASVQLLYPPLGSQFATVDVASGHIGKARPWLQLYRIIVHGHEFNSGTCLQQLQCKYANIALLLKTLQKCTVALYAYAVVFLAPLPPFLLKNSDRPVAYAIQN